MSTQDPTRAEPRPPFPEQEQEPPGRESEMKPLADHGEDSYVGHDRLKDRVALITGGDSAYISGEVIGATGGKPLH